MKENEFENHVQSFSRYLSIEAHELANEFDISKEFAVVVINRAMSVFVFEEMVRYRKYQKKKKKLDGVLKFLRLSHRLKPYEIRYSVSYLD